MEKLSEELLLALAVKNSGGGGGGTDDYNKLENQPQIGGVTLQGNKTASDLGLVAAETGKGLSSNDYTNEDKAIVGGVTAALAGKQDALTDGDYISIDAHNNISVNRELTPHQTSYRIKGIGQYAMNITKYIDGVEDSSTDYGYSQGTTRTIDDAFTINDTYSSSDGYIWQFVWLKDSTTHEKDYTVAYRAYNAAFDFTEVFDDEDLNGHKLVIKSEMDTALATKADLTDLAPAFSTSTAYTVGQYVSYDGNIYKCTSAHSAGAWVAGDFTLVAVGSELASKQDKTDNNLQTTDKTVVGAVNELKSGLTNQTARSRSNITSRLTNLVTAVAEQNLEKYGYKIGDYFKGASGYTYHLADMDTYYGGYNNNAIVNTHHISLVVKTGANSKWAETNDTSGGYKTSTLHSFLSSTVLDNIKSDMIALFGGSTGLEHLVSHKLLWTTATSAWAWSDNAEYISALSEPQVYGTNVWAIDGYQAGEAWKWLEIFHKFNYCEIIGNIWWWLRSISSASDACRASHGGSASYDSASGSGGAVGLIIFH